MASSQAIIDDTYKRMFGERIPSGLRSAARSIPDDQLKDFFKKNKGNESLISSFADKDKYLQEVEKYAAELESTAKDNFDFITKFLDKQHASALGTSDSDLARFYEDVSSSLEEKIGRIPFDFQNRTAREKEDLQNELASIAEAKRRIREQSEFESGLETEQREQEFNTRGLLGSGIQAKKAQEQERARQLRLAAQIEPLQERERLAGIGSTRSLEDITTQARRDAQDFSLSEEQTREGSQLELDQRLAEIRREKAGEERTVRALLSQREELARLNA